MKEGFGEIDVAISLMKEALTMLDALEAAPAARLLQMAMDAANNIGARRISEATDLAPDATGVRE